MKKKLLLFCFIAGFIGLCSYSSGPGLVAGLNRTGSQGSTPGCGSGCHDFSANTAVTIEVDSLTFPVTHYTPGFTYTIKIHGTNTISQPAFGFQFSAVSGIGGSQVQAGTFSAIPGSAHSIGVNGLTLIEHSSPISSGGGLYNVSFSWTAPAAGTGTVSMYIALNAVNLSGTNQGDQYNFSSTTLTETVCSPPAITGQPATQSACVGAAATFSVTTSSPGVTYQWRFNGIPISGATNSTYTIPSVALANGGNYTVALTNTCGNTLSNIAVLTVNTTPVITTQPVAVTACLGTAATFSVVTSTPSVTYQWQFNSGNISGATNSTYTIPSVAVANGGNYSVIITNTCGNTTSNVVALTVTQPPVITTQPIALTVCSGASATFSVVTSSPGVTYQWKFNNVNISNATNSSYTINPVALANAGNYSVVLTNSCGSTTSNSVSLTVNTVPVIATQPLSQSVCTGGTASFSVTATTPGVTYQWQFNNAPISGATNSTYSIPGVAPVNAGNYNVVLTNTCGNTTSNTAVLTINQPPVLNTQPQSQTVCAGNAVSFTVSTSTPSVTYQWQYNSTPITGATNNTYTIASAIVANSGNYNVIVTNSCGGSTTSNTVVLTVDSLPVINTQPVAQTACTGNAATFSVASATPGTTYQWQFNGSPIAGTTNNTYTIPSVTIANAGNYSVILTNTCGSTTSSIVTLTVNSLPAITTQPVAQTICAGSNVTFSVTTATPGVTYQWQFNNNSITGATNSNYTITNATAGNAGNYNVVITNTCGSTTSSTVVLTVNISAPVITTQPVDASACTGTTFTFSVATSTPGSSYQWSFTGNPITGATNSTYTIANITAANAGNYSITLSNSCGNTISNIVTLTVDSLPAIGTQPATQSLCAGNAATFFITTPTGGVSYQWAFTGNNIAGATDSIYSIPVVTSGNAGNYTVILTDVCGSTNSSIATLTVDSLPVITVQPVAQAICEGNAVTFTLSATAGISYQWHLNGAVIPNATNNTYSIPAASIANAGNYYATVTNACGNSSSDTVALTVNPLPVPLITQNGLVLNTGSFSTYQWIQDGTNISGATQSSYTVSQNGTYNVTVTDANGCTGTSATVIISGLGINTISKDEISIYPNPAHTIIYINSPHTVNVILKDAAGRILIEKNQAKTVDIKDLADGVYFISLTNDAGQTLLVQKVIKSN